MADTATAIKNVLVVDDDPVLCLLAESYFESRGAQSIWMAQDGKQAIDVLFDRAREIDFMLIDLNMPELDGIQFLRYLKKCDYTGPFAILSGESGAVVRSAQSLARAHNLNLLGALSKPFDSNALTQLLDKSKIEPREPIVAKDEPTPVTPSDLEAALSAGHILPHYQPKLDVNTGNVTGAEALARWIHAERGVIPPDVFIPMAERYGLIGTLTDVMFQRAVVDASHWARAPWTIKCAINLSAHVLANLDFPDLAAERVNAAGLDRGNFIFEITESQVLQQRANAAEVLTRLRLLGFEISIDDFGTGYSNIENLSEFPFTELKIDRSFVRNAINDPFAQTCVETSVQLGKKLDLRVVAEGVETAEDWDFVAAAGVDEVQGYYIAKPMPADAFRQWCLKQMRQ
jgi:EAL domain-containing protein (putative c-di-GMP-specific phosphodiesterase class I)/ActR/RegA family two-component response regulator